MFAERCLPAPSFTHQLQHFHVDQTDLQPGCRPTASPNSVTLRGLHSSAQLLRSMLTKEQLSSWDRDGELSALPANGLGAAPRRAAVVEPLLNCCRLPGA